MAKPPFPPKKAAPGKPGDKKMPPWLAKGKPKDKKAPAMKAGGKVGC